MFKSVSKRHLAQAALIAAIAVAAGCGEETIETTDIADPAQPPAAATPIANYSGPGSNWDIALNDDGSYAVSAFREEPWPLESGSDSQVPKTRKSFLRRC